LGRGTIKLILTIKAIVEPITKQELIGIDFADYRLVFENKGFYQTKTFTQKALLKAKENNENWLTASVIIVTIFLKVDGAIKVFNKVSEAISNMLEGNDPLWLFTAVIEEKVNNEPMIVVIYR
jgi:cell division GTPase FtsZ